MASSADGPLLAYGARIAGDDARTRVVIEFDRAPDFFVHYVSDPFRVVVDLPETSFGLNENDMKARGLFGDIRYGTMGAGSSRIVLTANQPVEISLAEVKPDEDKKGFRLVLDAERVSKERFTALLDEQKWTGSVTSTKTSRVTAPAPVNSENEFVVAVDAGHGGIDTGAIGTETRIEEKSVTLAFARDLVAQLDREPGIKAFLTREKDEFLSLPQRVQVARRQGANLFVSIHADTLKQRDIRGATVYTISDKASDHLAASLAERENLSDAVAGIALSTEPAEVADILLDLTRRETQAFSVNLAQTVVSSFEGQINLINNPHRYAGFRVLQAPDVPSILLELGFLSNKEDEKLLVDPAWRRRVSELLSGAVRNYRTSIVANGG
ncbi:N-acetylmuramoyl-L-alanine amidase [Pararhizobium capsulatum DSM 1112]|uniref:N-acetylmuramoyl-L-alanine amidase n=1 Tax=Pararhizobium capsulatum DSM 1112 TaxID=1121113 RepID=A0ABU0BQ35_9HYPH|nr:N-acetylmuramoyl-L-alanine amidase [Pararhizobium capsulatum]MDQ0320350.1 N-acetylmuramoyl-L-alanine amidase [Pararhizobium capsulatum DSM 1112]